jgi:peptide methionine sulfoxide reductase MsrA
MLIHLTATLPLVAVTAFTSTSTTPSTLKRNTHLRSVNNDINMNNMNNEASVSNRRSFMKNFVIASGLIGTTTTTTTNINVANAIDVESLSSAEEDVYFGVGCYWHIQHEFVEAERKLLNRDDAQLTSRTGYAGGKATDKEGRVCYHNFSGIADYGKLGHGEVVGMKIPQSSIGDFAQEYFALFTSKGERVDPMDKGGEYRSLLGLPGGTSHPAYPLVEKAASEKGMKLLIGKGNDPDTLGTKSVYVYDTKSYPFYQAEVYHQFHNDFQSPAYGKKYNSLQQMAFDDGRLKITGCPDKV